MSGLDCVTSTPLYFFSRVSVAVEFPHSKQRTMHATDTRQWKGKCRCAMYFIWALYFTGSIPLARVPAVGFESEGCRSKWLLCEPRVSIRSSPIPNEPGKAPSRGLLCCGTLDPGWNATRAWLAFRSGRRPLRQKRCIPLEFSEKRPKIRLRERYLPKANC